LDKYKNLNFLIFLYINNDNVHLYIILGLIFITNNYLQLNQNFLIILNFLYFLIFLVLFFLYLNNYIIYCLVLNVLIKDLFFLNITLILKFNII